jgi:hypothetical protein
MADEFFLSSLDNGWFSANFEDFHLFGYVGDQQRLLKTVSQKSILRRAVEVFAPRINIASIVNALAHYPLLAAPNPDKTLAREIINIVTSDENQRRLTDLLALTYKRGRRHHTYFDHVSKTWLNKTTLFEASFNELQDRLVTVEGQLVHRTAVGQFSRELEAMLRESNNEWILADWPPHCFVQRNERFSGKVLILHEDPGFSDTFASHLPFSRELAWYPYVRVTGFFDASKLQTELLPSLSISLVEYRRPKVFLEMRATVQHFFESELREQRIYLRDWSNLVLAAYLVPILFAASNLSASEASSEVAVLLCEYRTIVAGDMPKALNAFYGEVCGT